MMESDDKLDAFVRWQGNIGSLPGSLIKFIKKDDRILMIDDPKIEARHLVVLDAFDNNELQLCHNCHVPLLVDELFRNKKYCRNCSKIAPATLAIHNGSSKQKKTVKRLALAKNHAQSTSETKQEAPTSSDVNPADSIEIVPQAPSGSTKTKEEPMINFSWNGYIGLRSNLVKTPDECLLSYQRIPTAKNAFAVGQKLDSFDPNDPSRLTSMVVSSIKCNRMCLQYCVKKEEHYQWVNVDYPLLIHSEVSHKYIRKKKEYSRISGPPAPLLCFPMFSNEFLKNTKLLHDLGFKPGYKLEALDKSDAQFTICVATISEVFGDYILIHFDGWDNQFDYWTHYTSPFIHPVHWCRNRNVPLTAPFKYGSREFKWEEYLEETKAQTVPATSFNPRKVRPWKVGMCLEMVDHRNPVFIRPARVVEVKPYHLKIHWEGWLDVYDYWVEDDSFDIHAVGYCEATGHDLHPPPGYTIDGKKNALCWPNCKGQSLGNAQVNKFLFHNKPEYCPYNPKRLASEHTIKIEFYDTFYQNYRFPSQNNPKPPIQADSSASIEMQEDSDMQPMNIEDLLEFQEAYYDFQLKEIQSTINPNTVQPRGWLDKEEEQPDECKRREIAGVILQWDVEQVKDFVLKFTKSNQVAISFASELMDGIALMNAPKEVFERIIPSKTNFLKIYNEILAIKEKLCNTY